MIKAAGRQVISRDWLAMYFAHEYEKFLKETDQVSFETGLSSLEVFEKFCKWFRDNVDSIDQEDIPLFAPLFDAWYQLKKKFEEKHNPLTIFPDYYDPLTATEKDEVKGGFISLKGAYVLHPMAKQISKSFFNCHFSNGFSTQHQMFLEE